ncbi:MAG: hypothetical protein QOD75_3410 [Blastocatellia bacterium]|jgi:hypothetical protein|nr:hypothetical protein [Blastocatellia bacterium]
MNYKKCILTVIAVFIVANVLGMVIHALLLAPDYAKVPNLYRPKDGILLFWINVAYLAFAIGATWIYSKGVEANRPWMGQGLRFGLALWLVLAVPSFVMAYAVQPMPSSLMLKQVGYELVGKLLIGLVIAALYREA